MSDIAIQTNGLGKSYKLGLSRRGYGTLRESVVEAGAALARPARSAGAREARGRHPLGAARRLARRSSSGEVVGLIGHNGAGKSTLLKILSRITEPTTGWADVTGRVGSLLEVGTGFHPELTGRENVFLNGAILGMRRAEIRARFDEIVDFAEIERFLDTPVKRYSSGMYVRLAFAVAAHLEPEILLVDEVLAVGDAAFQRKSLGKMGEVAEEGRTVIFVSHNLAIDPGALPARRSCSSAARSSPTRRSSEAVDQLPARARARRLATTCSSAPTATAAAGDETLVARLEIHDGDERRSADVVVGGRAGEDRRRGDRGAADDGVPADDRQQPRPAGHHARQRGSAPGRRPRRRARDRGSSARSTSLPLMPGRYRIDVLLQGRAGRSRTASRPPPSSTSSRASSTAGRCPRRAPTATSSCRTRGDFRPERAFVATLCRCFAAACPGCSPLRSCSLLPASGAAAPWIGVSGNQLVDQSREDGAPARGQPLRHRVRLRRRATDLRRPDRLRPRSRR